MVGLPINPSVERRDAPETLAGPPMRRYHGRLTWHATLLGLFLLLVAGGIGFPLPEDLTLLGGGLLAHERVLRLRDVIAIGFLGVVVPDWIIYLVGRRYGHGIVRHPFLARRFGVSRL